MIERLFFLIIAVMLLAPASRVLARESVPLEVRYLNEGRRAAVAVSGPRGGLFVFDPDTGQLVQSYQPSANQGIRAFGRSSGYLVAAEEPARLVQWSGGLLGQQKSFTFPEGEITHLAVSNRHRDAIVVFEDQSFAVYDLRGSVPSDFLGGLSAPVSSVAVSPTRQFVFFGLESGGIEAFYWKSGFRIFANRPFNSAVTALANTPDDLIAGSRSGEVQLLSARSGASMRTIGGLGAAVLDLQTNSTADWLAAASEDGRVTIWSLPTGVLMEQKRLSPSPIVSLSFSEKSGRLIVLSRDGALVVCDDRSLVPIARFRISDWLAP